MSGPELDFLEVGPFLDGAVRREALHAALALGLIDELERRGGMEAAALTGAAGLHASQAAVLLDLLVGHGVLARSAGTLRLAPRFARALRCRDLLETQLDYARSLAPRMQRSYVPLLRGQKGALAELVDFFHYDADPNPSEAVLAKTAPWVRYMSTMTRYHAPLLARRLPLSEHRSALDVGGNNGELAMALCRRAPGLRVRVADLPAVCVLGRRHVAAAGLAERIEFLPLDAKRQPLPTGADLILFKSVLHDFEEEAALRVLRGAARALPPGGRIAVFERHAPDLAGSPLPDHEIVNVPFLGAFRAPGFYARALEGLGFDEVRVEPVREIRFSLVIAGPARPRSRTSRGAGRRR